VAACRLVPLTRLNHTLFKSREIISDSSKVPLACSRYFHMTFYVLAKLKELSLPNQNSSGNGASKSSLVQIMPRFKPAIRFFFLGASEARRATGLPFWVMTTSPLRSTIANRSANCFSTRSRFIICVDLVTPYAWHYNIADGNCSKQ
ncbi:MAG: hypothetical protein ACOYNY_33780, partial [Caldilineaceae bacterium]